MLIKSFVCILLALIRFELLNAMSRKNSAQADLVIQTLNGVYSLSYFKQKYAQEPFDVDLIATTTTITLGQLIAQRLVSSDRENALAVALKVQNNRSDKNIVLQTLYKAGEIGEQAHKDLKVWVTTFGGNVDAIDYSPGMTIGERITELLQTQEHREKAFKIALLVQDDRENEDIVFLTLYKAYEKDERVLELLKTWVEEFKEDVEYINYAPGKTVGERISELLKIPEHRGKALEVALLFQKGRRKMIEELRTSIDQSSESILRTLYAAYEQDATAFDALKQWQELVQADVRVIRFDPAHPQTIAERIDALKRDDLSKLFKLSAPREPNGSSVTEKAPRWSTSKVIGAASLAVGIVSIAVAWYYVHYEDRKNFFNGQLHASPFSLPAPRK